MTAPSVRLLQTLHKQEQSVSESGGVHKNGRNDQPMILMFSRTRENNFRDSRLLLPGKRIARASSLAVKLISKPSHLVHSPFHPVQIYFLFAFHANHLTAVVPFSFISSIDFLYNKSLLTDHSPLRRLRTEFPPSHVLIRLVARHQACPI